MKQNLYLNRYSIGSPHSEYLLPLDYAVLFTNEERNIQTQIVDREGNICGFPGVEYTQALVQELGKREILPVVKYETRFERSAAGGFLMIWTVRPDGFYWTDSWGFGAEDYESVELYARIDENGRFTGPFRLYRIGYREIEEDAATCAGGNAHESDISGL